MKKLLLSPPDPEKTEKKNASKKIHLFPVSPLDRDVR